MTDVVQSTPRTAVGLFALATGVSVGRYVITSVLGQGGFGITYRARDSQLDRDVAIKEYLPVTLAVRQDGITVLPRSTEVAEDFIWGRDRFVAEGRTLASLNDAPAIVRVFDFLESNGTAYIVMELVPGETLDSRLRRQGPFTPPEVDTVLPPLLDGLEQVHRTGFLHRDIKPANILLRPDGRPVLIDFGASRTSMAGRSTAMTAIFTPGFAAVEQMTSARQGPWTDIYGLAATMYAAISGATPPPSIDRMLEDTIQPLSRLAPERFSPALLQGLDAGMAVRAGERPQSIAAWRNRLQGIAPDPSETATQDAAVTVLLRPPLARDGLPSQDASLDATIALATPTPSQSVTGARKSMVRYASLAIAALLLMGAGYYALQDRSKPPPAVALQDMKVEDLERVLDARRKADAEASEKRRVEEEAKKKANDEAEGKRRADAELEQARQDRQNAERELEKLRAQLEEQKKVAADAQRQAQIEEEQRKAETAAADKRRLEEEAQKKADLEARQTEEAEAALARAQADREKADAEAKSRQEDEVRRRADADARTRAEADAREKEKAAADKAKQEADEKKAAETAEAGLRLSQTDRQRLQVALTSQGFDTRGSDGAFGPRTREMITGWQKARRLPATGYLSAAQQQQLQREAAAALQKYDEDQKKTEDEKKKAEDDKKKAEEEAKAKGTPAAAATPAAPGGPLDGVYGGSLGFSTAVATFVTVNVRGTSVRGEFSSSVCGSYPFSLVMGADGQLSGTIESRVGLNGCLLRNYTATGRIADGAMQLELRGPWGNGSLRLLKGVSAPAAPTTPAPSPFDGYYDGNLSLIRTGVAATVLLGFNVRIAGTEARGAMQTRACGYSPFSVTVAADGRLSGTATLPDHSPGCTPASFSIVGRATKDSLELNLSAAGGRISGSLRKSASP